MRLKLHREEVGFYKGKHSLSCNCQLLPTRRDGIKWIYAKETKRGKEKAGKKGRTGIIVHKQCLLMQFLDDSSFDNMSFINILAATVYGIKSIGEVKFLL